MVREIIKPKTSNINLSIPLEYIGKEVEILVFPVNITSRFEYDEKNEQERRKKAFENFMKLKGTLPGDFDYKKELAEYRDERYGHIN